MESLGKLYCNKCKDATTNTNTVLIKKHLKDKAEKIYVQGSCSVCKKAKSRVITVIEQGCLPDEMKNLSLGEVRNITSLLSNPLITPDTTVVDNSLDGGDLLDTIENIGGPLIRKGINFGVRQIPLIGDLIADTGIVNAAIDWGRDNIWNPIKKAFTGKGFSNDMLDNVMKDDRLISHITQNMFENKIHSGQGIVPKYIANLRSGNEEEKMLSELLLKTISKPRFYKFIDEKKIPHDTSLLKAIMMFKNRNKEYTSDIDKSIATLKGHGYEII